MGKAFTPGEARDAVLTRMMQLYAKELTGLCATMIGDCDLAQDAVQETFMRAYRAMDSYRGESEKAWLTGIAINVSRNIRRSAWFRVRRQSVPVDERIPAQVCEEDRGLFQMVCALDRRSREVILMRYYQEMTVHEIAAALSVSESAVYKRLDNAKQRLKKTLERRGDEWMKTDCARL